MQRSRTALITPFRSSTTLCGAVRPVSSSSPSTNLVFSSQNMISQVRGKKMVTRSSAKKRFKISGPYDKRKVTWHPKRQGGKQKRVGPEVGHFRGIFPHAAL